MIKTEKSELIDKLNELISILSSERFKYKIDTTQVDAALHYLDLKKSSVASLEEDTIPVKKYGVFQSISSLSRAFDEMFIDWRTLPAFQAKVVEAATLSGQFATAHRPFKQP